VSRYSRQDDQRWQQAYFLVFLFGVLISVVAGIAVAALGDPEPGEPFSVFAVLLDLTALVMVLIALANRSCLGASMAFALGVVGTLWALIAALQSTPGWNWGGPY
jgi:hypothetical protein